MTKFNHGPVRPDEWNYYVPLVGDSMLELGDKINPAWSGEHKTYKSHFESLGFRHVSIDWNGNNGAIARDLRKPLWDEFGRNAFARPNTSIRRVRFGKTCGECANQAA
jgi:hypothetical protein